MFVRGFSDSCPVNITNSMEGVYGRCERRNVGSQQGSKGELTPRGKITGWLCEALSLDVLAMHVTYPEVWLTYTSANPNPAMKRHI